jgi:hypothetical protein
LGYATVKVFDVGGFISAIRIAAVNILTFFHDHFFWWLPYEVITSSFTDLYDPLASILATPINFLSGLLEGIANIYTLNKWRRLLFAIASVAPVIVLLLRISKIYPVRMKYVNTVLYNWFTRSFPDVPQPYQQIENNDDEGEQEQDQ